MHHFREMMCTASLDCGSRRGISWQPLVLCACSQAMLHTKVMRLWQGCCTSWKLQCCSPTELELISTDWATLAQALKRQKHPVVLSPCSGPCWTIQVSQPFIPHSLYQVTWVLSMPKAFQHLVDPFTSCAPQDGHQCLCQSMVWQALDALHRTSVQSFKISI